MYRLLNIPRSLNDYKKETKVYNTKLESTVTLIFREDKNNDGFRKIKIELIKRGIIASRRMILAIMDKYKLISNYNVKQHQVSKHSCNEDPIANIVNR